MDAPFRGVYGAHMQNTNKDLIPGWDAAQVREWRESVIVQGRVRDYHEDIVLRARRLPENSHSVTNYGITSGDYHPLLLVSVGDANNGNPNILLTGGVHGCEPSGVEAIFRFLEEDAPQLTNKFNFFAYPCISPWAYEYNQRWNKQAEDPNRLFTSEEKPVHPGTYRTYDIDECRHFMNSIQGSGVRFNLALDLHEILDWDIELRKKRADRFGEKLADDFNKIPQGYYLTLTKQEELNSNVRQLLLGKTILEEVRKFSPIAPEETILGGKKNYGGVILSPPLAGSMRTHLSQGKYAKWVAITEVYPDHPDMTPEKAVLAQLASIRGGLNFVQRYPL